MRVGRKVLVYGAGEGCQEGERIKASPQIAEEMLAVQPSDVLGGKRYILVKPYEDTDGSFLFTNGWKGVKERL